MQDPFRFIIFNWPCTCYRLAPTGVTSVVNSNQATLRHTKSPAYRCFLPDLTGFTGFHCVRPDFHCHLRRADPTGKSLRQEFNPATADCRKRAPLPPRLARPKLDNAIYHYFPQCDLGYHQSHPTIILKTPCNSKYFMLCIFWKEYLPESKKKALDYKIINDSENSVL
jgi:hypothetical protein